VAADGPGLLQNADIAGFVRIVRVMTFEGIA